MPKARIVVVEDEPAIRRGVSDALRLSGYDVSKLEAGKASPVLLAWQVTEPRAELPDAETPPGVASLRNRRADLP